MSCAFFGASSNFGQEVDGENAVPLLLAAEAHGAKQLAQLCKYHISIDLPQAQKHEQWAELKEIVRQQVVLEYQRLQSERAMQRDAKELAHQIPCLLAPVVEG